MEGSWLNGFKSLGFRVDGLPSWASPGSSDGIRPQKLCLRLYCSHNSSLVVPSPWLLRRGEPSAAGCFSFVKYTSRMRAEGVPFLFFIGVGCGCNLIHLSNVTDSASRIINPIRRSQNRQNNRLETFKLWRKIKSRFEKGGNS